MPTQTELPEGIERCSMGGKSGFRAKGNPPTACHIHDGSESGMASALRKAAKDKTNPNHVLKKKGMSELETVDLPGVPILGAGGPFFGTGSPEGGDYFEPEFLNELATNYEELKHEVRIPIKIGHSRNQKLLKNTGLSVDEQPAAGWAENLRVTGNQLIADLRSVPKKLADLIKVGAFRTRSVELGPVTSQTKDGKEFDTVVTGLALLGAKAPAVRTLDDILAFYSEADASAAELLWQDAADPEVKRTVDFAEGGVTWQAGLGANDMREDLNAAVRAEGSGCYVQDIDQVNRKAIVCDYSAKAYWVIPYQLSEDGDPVPAPFSEWVLAEQPWVEKVKEQTALAAKEFAATRVSGSKEDTLDMSVTEQTPFEKLELSDDQVQVFAETFGIEEDDASKRREAVLTKLSDATTRPPTPAPTPQTTALPPSTPAAGDETVSLSAKELEELRVKADLGAKAFADRRDSRVKANLAVAVKQNRISPAQVKDWERMYSEIDYEVVTEALLHLPMNPTLTKTYGSDDEGKDPQKNREDAWYREYAALTNVPTTQEGSP